MGSASLASVIAATAISRRCSRIDFLILARQHVFHRHARLGSCDLSGRGHVKRQHYLKLASLSNHAAHFDAAMMFFHDTAGKGKTKTCAVSLGGVERPENVWNVLGRDAMPSVADNEQTSVQSVMRPMGSGRSRLTLPLSKPLRS